jgi:MFS family permease
MSHVFHILSRLGGARAINRRYISDHVPVKQLTSASAAFVSASALGMAVGPALAGALSKLDFKVSTLTTRIASFYH